MLFGIFALQQSKAQSAIDAITFTWVDVNNSANDYTATSPNNAGQSIDANTTYSIRFASTNTVENNRRLNSFTVNGTNYAFLLEPDTLALRRLGTATRLSLWIEAESIDNTGDIITLNPERQVPERTLYQASLLNIGYDNVLVNSGTNSSNIERIDAIFRTGMLTATPANALIPVLDRGANAEFKIAAILSLDANGDPASFGSLVEVVAGDSGGQVLSIGSSVLFLQQSLGQNPIPTGSSTQGVGGVAISLQELGVSANQIIYGYSLFSSDVDAGIHDLTDISTFPTNSNNSGLDFGAGAVSAVSSDGKLVKATGPGGYKSALSTWLKANEGVTTATDGSTVTDWQDQSLGDHDAVTLQTAPTYRDGSASGLEDVNFNPTVDFLDGLERGLQIANNSDYNVGGAPYTNKSFNVAIRTGNNVTTKQQLYEQGDDDRGIDMYIESGNLVVTAYNKIDDSGSGVSSPWNTGTSTTISTAITTETEYVITFELDGSASGTGTVTAYLNGKSFGNFSSVGQLADHDDEIGLGDFNSQSIVTTPAACPVQSVVSSTGVINPGNITGAVDAAYAEVNTNGNIITVDFGQEYPAGTQYSITWIRRPSSTGTAIMVLRESTSSGSGFVDHSSPPSVSVATPQTDVVTAENAFRYLQITKTNPPSTVDFHIDAIVVDCSTEDITYAAGDAASFYGSIPEFIYCSEPSSFPLGQRQRIESYLALKYGVTLDQSSPINYVNSNGDIIFNTTNAASIGGYLEYNNDIAGIGRDDESEFIQTQSQSENNNSLVRINRTNGIAVDNTWLIWGNDGASATTTNSTDKPPLISERINRVWRVAEEGSMGITDISFDITDLGFGTNPADFSLLVAGSSSNGVFTSADVTIGATTSVIDGRTFLTFSDVDLADGEYFTLGTGFVSCGPGGVSTDLYVWLKPDLGTSTIVNNTTLATWTNQASGGPDATSDGNPPLFKNNSTDNINFNQTIDFDGTDDRLTFGNLPNIKSGAANGGDYTLIAVGIREDSDINYILGGTGGTNNEDLHYGYRSNTAATLAHWGNDINLTVNAFDNPQSPYILLGEYDGSTRIIEETRGNNFSRISGANSTDLSGTKDVFLGERSSTLNYNGRISEVIVFDNDISDLNKQQIYSYLAIKYGITLTNDADNDASTGETISGAITEGDYVLSDGTTNVWDFSANTAYHNGIAGIGRDDDACLNQKQSGNEEDDSIVSIGLNTVAATNSANSNSFDTDKDFMVWGHDGTAASTTQLTDVPGTVTERLSRIWKVQETGTVGETQLQFDITGLGLSGNASDFQLIISGSSTMASGSTFSGGTLNGNILTFDNVDFADGDFFTLGVARTTCGPGGVTASVGLWLRADAGTNTTTNGAAVTSWIDQSGNSNATVQNAGGGAPVEPLFIQEDINFNPAIRFTNSENTNNSWLETSANSATGNLSIISVFKTAQNDGSATNFTDAPALVSTETGSATNDWAMGVAQGRLYINANNSNDYNVRPATTYIDNVARIATATRTQASSATGINLYVNSSNVGTATSGTTVLNAAGTIAIGNHAGYDADGQYDGDIAETIIFNQVLSETDRARVESYLAIKYGITRVVTGLSEAAEDYLNADGDVIWNIDTQGVTYHNDIFGIGRDDDGCFLQEKSKSINSDALVTFEVDDALSADESYLISGNDNAAIEATGNTEMPVTINSRLNREWRVQETGNVGNITLTYDLSTITGPTGIGTNNNSQLRLMVDNDGDFTSGVTLISPSSIDAVNNTVSFTVNFNNGQYYTLGSFEEGALPVTLISFTAGTNNQQQIVVEWTTAQEEGNAFYSVERSDNGRVFETIGTREGAGNSNAVLEYKFIDPFPLEGRSFYRLKQTDFNGDFEYSKVVSVFFKPEVGPLSFSVFPNPVQAGEGLAIVPSSTDLENLSYQLFSSNGRQVSYGTYARTPQQFSIDTSRLKPGLYLLRLKTGSGQSFTQRVIIR